MSSSSMTPQEKYDVFISFRGEDTRNNFTSHLYEALCQKKIQTYIDYKLQRGDEISPLLLKAIEESKISILVLSQHYASSTWCLKELAEILKCKKLHQQIVIPIFYQVQPTDVRHQTGTFAEAFVEHEIYEPNLDKLETWRTALTETANLSGFCSAKERPDSELVKEIVRDVLRRLNKISESYYEDLIGIKSKITKIESLLCIGSQDVSTVGIWGLGGIGKTTVATTVFNKISHQFEAVHFVHNVRERLENEGLISIQQTLLSTILQDKKRNIGSDPLQSTLIRKRLGCTKVLIVFDDVTSASQIESLVGGFDLFSLGSRFLITTRDRQVLRNLDVEKIYNVEELSDHEALQLFNCYAFKKRNPTLEFNELSKKVVTKAKGVPLVLRVLGSSLFGKKEEEWKSALNKLEKIPHGTIHKVLKISYDELDSVVKKIFLDIACFFNLKDKDYVISFLDACGFFPDSGLDVLVDKSLITIEDNIITMHDLVQEMGWEVVRQESSYLDTCSRLWHPEDIKDVLVANKESIKAIEGISLDMSKIRERRLNLRAISKMENLRFFNFYNSLHKPCGNYTYPMLKIFEEFELASTRLSYFYWIGCPLKSMPLNCHLKYLVRLEMPDSNIEQLWNGIQDLFNLKHVDLSRCSSLTRCPNLSHAPKLEKLILNGCGNLVEIPTSTPLASLRTLDLSWCLKLWKLPEISPNIEELHLDGTAIKELPSSIGNLPKLVILRFRGIPGKDIPSLGFNKFKFIETVPVLRILRSLGFKKLLEPQPIEFQISEDLRLLKVRTFAFMELLSSMTHGFCSLTLLDLTYCGMMELPDSVGRLSSLKGLSLGSNRFVSIPASINDLSQLEWLDLSYCERLQFLPVLPRNVRHIKAQGCTSLEVISGLPSLFTNMSEDYKFDFSGCLKLDGKALMKDVIRAIQQKGTAWFEEMYNKKYVPRARIIAHKMEIPWWFIPSTSNVISLELPPNGNRNFVCVVCIAVVMVFDGRPGHFSFGSYDCKINGQSFHTDVILSRSKDEVIFDFFLLGYDVCPGDNSSNEVSFEFESKVEKLGVHLVYDQYFEEPTLQLNKRFNRVGSFFEN